MLSILGSVSARDMTLEVEDAVDGDQRGARGARRLALNRWWMRRNKLLVSEEYSQCNMFGYDIRL